MKWTVSKPPQAPDVQGFLPVDTLAVGRPSPCRSQGRVLACTPPLRPLSERFPVAIITHEQLTARLQALALPLAADALHGTLAGLACAGIGPESADWLDQLSECLDGAELDNHREAMAALQALVERDLADSDLGFQPMLPDGDEFLSVRAGALARWSEGFVCGFVAVQRELSSEDREVLDDIAAISQLDDEASLAEAGINRSELNNPANADDNERDFMELCEYVRLAAMDLYRENRSPAEPVADGGVA